MVFDRVAEGKIVGTWLQDCQPGYLAEHCEEVDEMGSWSPDVP